MAYVARTDAEIIAAYERWLTRVPDPGANCFPLDKKMYSAREIVAAIRRASVTLHAVYAAWCSRIIKASSAPFTVMMVNEEKYLITEVFEAIESGRLAILPKDLVIELERRRKNLSDSKIPESAATLEDETIYGAYVINLRVLAKGRSDTEMREGKKLQGTWDPVAMIDAACRPKIASPAKNETPSAV